MNASVNEGTRDRLVVYERDSVIYLRTLDSTGRWGAEHLISDAADTALKMVGAAKRNRADNMFPAIDMIRSGGASCAIVWERHSNYDDPATVTDDSLAVSVEIAWLPFRPARDTFPSAGSIIRRRLSVPRKFAKSWMQLTPAITGVDSGYIVAWAAAGYTTEVKAVRDNPVNGRFDTSRVLRLKMAPKAPLPPLDSAMGYPTLAYTRNWKEVALNDGVVSGPDDATAFVTMPSHIDGIADTTGFYHIAHLAYQQGARNAPHAFDIMYHMLGVRFPPLPPSADSGVPELWASAAENASYLVLSCDNIYQSIACDSGHVAVTFTRQSAYDNIMLRFRDTSATTPRRLRWNTTRYEWGGSDPRGVSPGFVAGAPRNYERSSLTMFPARDSASLADSYEGALTWQWTNAGSSRLNGVRFYRFGRYTTDSLLDGQHPTMMLVPSVGDDPVHAARSTGIVRRGPGSASFELRRQHGDTGVYFPAYLDNTPVAPVTALATSQPTDTIYASMELYKSLAGFIACPGMSGSVTTGLLFNPRDTIHDGPAPPLPPPPPSTVMPPTFFPKSPTFTTAFTTLSHVMNITRTPVFQVDSMPVTLTRLTFGNDSLIPWLNSQPYDTVHLVPANVYFSLEIVRDSDGAVLWVGDTMSARGIGGDTLLEEVSIPVDTVVAPGTSVYIRVAAIPTVGLRYEVNGGFHFLNPGGSGGSALKRVVQPYQENVAARGNAINVRIIPNPLRGGSGDLHVRVPEPGPVTIVLYDILGHPVMNLPKLDAKRAGEYVVPLELSTLGDGVYVVDVQTGYSRNTIWVTLMR